MPAARRWYDYRLKPSSPCRRTAVKPGSANGFSLVPCFEYASVAGRTPRADGGTTAGAFGG